MITRKVELLFYWLCNLIFIWLILCFINWSHRLSLWLPFKWILIFDNFVTFFSDLKIFSRLFDFYQFWGACIAIWCWSLSTNYSCPKLVCSDTNGSSSFVSFWKSLTVTHTVSDIVSIDILFVTGTLSYLRL